MKAISSRQKWVLAAAGLLAGAFLLHHFILEGLAHKIAGLDSNMALQEKQLRKFLEIDAQKEAIHKQYEKNIIYFRSKTATDRDAYVRFLKEVETLCQDSDLSVQTINPSNEPEEVNGVKKFHVDVRADATPAELILFLKRVEKSEFLTKIDRLSVSAKNDDGSSLKIEATLSISLVK